MNIQEIKSQASLAERCLIEVVEKILRDEFEEEKKKNADRILNGLGPSVKRSIDQWCGGVTRMNFEDSEQFKRTISSLGNSIKHAIYTTHGIDVKN